MKQKIFVLIGLFVFTNVLFAQIDSTQQTTPGDSVDFTATAPAETTTVAAQPTPSPQAKKHSIWSGPFTIAPNVIVKFSPGNLQYNPKENKWRFAPHQHEMIGKANSKISENYDGWIDLFGWGTAKTPTLFAKEDNYASHIEAGNFPIALDWGRHEINGYQPLLWRTMTKDEWAYLFNERKNAKDLVTLGTIEGINGLIILPDNWNHKWDKENFTYPLLFNLKSYSGYNFFPLEVWETHFEKKGAIFLPCSGFREGKVIKQINTGGSYWSSTGYRNQSAYSFTFGANYLLPTSDFARYKARAVRLVHKIRGK